jgi:membrane-associated phospholipid phosphatase
MPKQPNTLAPVDLLPCLPLTRSRRVARWVSRAASPPILAAGGTVMTAAQISEGAAWLWATFTIALSILVPSLFIVMLMKRGKITDFDVYLREQRYLPYLISVSCSSLSWLVLTLARAPHIFIIVTGAAAGQSILMFLVNLKWKISVHASGTACFAVLIWQLFGLPGAGFLLAIPLVAWSRVRLGRHTVGQVIAGSTLGAVLLFTIFKIWA